MKRFYQLLLLFLLPFSILQAQVDTILFENFQVNPFPEMDTMAVGDNSNWVNFDEDGFETAFGTPESKQWFWGEFFTDAVDPVTGETNYVATTLSFLSGFVPGNRNWMVLPPVEVTDETFMLHWQSAPNQMPRYMDGYVVMVSNGSNEIAMDNFTDTLFQAASMLDIPGNGQSVDYSNFTFTEGYLHADGATLTDYFADDGGGTLYRGLLEPHSASLADYMGQTIYIAFLHNSDDDERLAVDDILVTKAMSSNTNEETIAALRMETYPNPVAHQLNLNYTLDQKTNVAFQIINANGQLIKQKVIGEQTAGQHQAKLHLSWLPSGHYFLQLNVGEQMATQAFFKK